MEQLIDLIFVIDFVGLIILLAGIRYWQKKHGRMPDKRFALILIGYWSFLTVTTFSPLLKVNFWVTVLIEIVLLLVWWCIGYPWVRWLYQKFVSSKR